MRVCLLFADIQLKNECFNFHGKYFEEIIKMRCYTLYSYQVYCGNKKKEIYFVIGNADTHPRHGRSAPVLGF